MVKKRVTIDFETRSACDLKKSGAYKYSLHPTTQPTCLAYKPHGDKRVRFLSFKTVNTHWSALPQMLKDEWEHFIDLGYLFSAHNALFDRFLYDNILVRRYGWPEIPTHLWRCTAAKAAACALPRNLAGAGEALQLKVQKDPAGYAAVMATCKPTRAYTAYQKIKERIAAGARVTDRVRERVAGLPPPMFLEPEMAPSVWETLYKYCRIDVRAEELLDDTLPDLSPDELKIWQLNQTINARGMRVDLPTVKKIVAIMEVENKKRLRELDDLTMGLVKTPHCRADILDFLALDGVALPDIRAKTIEEILKAGDLHPDMQLLLKIRQAFSKASTKKYLAMLDRCDDDGVIRDILLYHGASTGRDTGTGVQPHNFPKPVIEIDKDNPYVAIKDVVKYDAEMLKLLYGDALAYLFSSVLRNVIIARPGRKLFVADFSKIEVAALWWLADNEPGLRILRDGKDPYIYQASANLGRSYDEIERAVEAGEAWAMDARQLGKAQILGCGFGMGRAKFKITAWDFYRLTLSEVQSKKAVDDYRSQNETVPLMWKAVERAAIHAVKEHVKIRTNKCTFFCKDKFLWIELPSGRRLAYREPHIVMRESEWGPQETLQFWAPNSKTKRWGPERTWGGTLVENIVQAVARDCMMLPLPDLEDAGFEVKICVHDEAVCEGDKGKTVEEFINILCKPRPWMDGLPLEAKGWSSRRYRK